MPLKPGVPLKDHRSIAETNGVMRVSEDVQQALGREEPLYEILSVSAEQLEQLLTDLEKEIGVKELEQPTKLDPERPETMMIDRIEHVKRGLRSIQELLTTDVYDIHPSKRLPDCHKLNKGKIERETNLANVLRITKIDPQIPDSKFADPNLTGFPLRSLESLVAQNLAKSAQSSAEETYEKALAQAKGAVQHWEKTQTPGRISFEWGNVSGDTFLSDDTHLEIDIAYTAEHGFVAIPRLVLKTDETKRFSNGVLYVEGEQILLESLNGKNIKDLQNELSLIAN